MSKAQIAKCITYRYRKYHNLETVVVLDVHVNHLYMNIAMKLIHWDWFIFHTS